MILYNVSVKLQAAIAPAWIQWLKENHIPDILATGCFIHANCFQLLEMDDSEGPTYVIQYVAENISAYQHYIDNFSSALRQKAIEKWGDKFIAFRTVMQAV
jgi:hypothetical protein